MALKIFIILILCVGYVNAEFYCNDYNDCIIVKGISILAYFAFFAIFTIIGVVYYFIYGIKAIKNRCNKKPDDELENKV